MSSLNHRWIDEATVESGGNIVPFLETGVLLSKKIPTLLEAFCCNSRIDTEANSYLLGKGSVQIPLNIYTNKLNVLEKK